MCVLETDRIAVEQEEKGKEEEWSVRAGRETKEDGDNLCIGEVNGLDGEKGWEGWIAGNAATLLGNPTAEVSYGLPHWGMETPTRLLPGHKRRKRCGHVLL